MGRYRKIDTRIWNDAKFCSLSNEGKLLFLFLLTHPHLTSIGAMRATITGLAAELGWSSKSLREAFGEAFRKGLVEHDEKACFVGIPNFLRYNGPESPNVVKSWSDSLDLIPECALKVQLLQRVKGFTEGLSEAFTKALPEAFRKGMPNPEQEQEQDITPYSPPRGTNGSTPFQNWWTKYPRKVSRKKAGTAYERAVKSVMAEQGATAAEAHGVLLEAVEAFAASALGRNQKFCPHPTTWLNGGRWADDRSDWDVQSSVAGRLDERQSCRPLTSQELAEWRPS